MRGTGGREVGKGRSLDCNGLASRAVLSSSALGCCRCSCRLRVTKGGQDRAVLGSRALADYGCSCGLRVIGGDRAVLSSSALGYCSCSCRLRVTMVGQDGAVLSRTLGYCRTRDLCAKGTLETRAGLALLARTSQIWASEAHTS